MSCAIVDDDQNLDKILDKFKNLNDDQDLGNTEQYLIDSFNTDANICLICIESIGIRQAIWNCEGCFAQFHIPCIQNWIREGSYLAISANFDAETNPKNIPWNCPKCRKTYQQDNYPSVYYCYCRKVKDPVFDPWSLPHSCNQTCGKAKPCGHSCLTLCHPGPCPPCPKMVMVSCSCSKSQPVARRCSNKHWSCNKTCNRLLPCKQHLCERMCHEGSCGECKKTSIQFCKCKKSRKEVLCTETVWQCEQKCLKNYLCGYHKCESVCHSGPCGDCPKSLIRTCPCGKSKSTKPCNEDIPTCGDTCNKLLSCGIHMCAMRCHYGPCETCRQLVIKKCRCGQKEKTLPCFTEFTCEQKCNRMRNCGKHKCNKKCCEGNCPPCEQICNKPLSCKNHKCKSLCHSGPCYPCPLMEEISCPCGSSKIKVPCVKSNSNIKVSCKQSCNREARCHHGKIQRHRCHYGDCPPCELKCELKLKCAHLCQTTCHDSVLTEIVENKDRDGPWLPLNRKKVHVKLPCPECNHPIPTRCLGNHEISDVPCYRQGPFSCGRKCERPLKCSHHTCQLECHFIPEDELNITNQASSKCEECTRDCEQARPKGCEHECSIGVCHPGECPKCVQLIKMKCHCQSNFVYVECNKWNNSNNAKRDREDLQSCKVPCSKNISCGHNCTLKCHSGQCSKESECSAKVTLRCQCKKLKKSFVCNQIKSQFERQKSSSSEDELIKVNDRICLKCNQKCSDEKQKVLDVDAETKEAAANVSSNRQHQSSYFIYYLLAFIFLFLSIFLVYIVSSKSSN